jgi:hypothetical protein
VVNAYAIGFSGLPPGLKASYDIEGKQINFSGTPSDTGTYILKLTTLDCIYCTTYSDTIEIYIPEQDTISDTVTVSIAKDLKNALNFYIYPNPANDILTINFESDINSKVEIEFFDITGCIIYREQRYINRQASCVEKNISGLKPGIYFVKINNKEFSRTTRFIKR